LIKNRNRNDIETTLRERDPDHRAPKAYKLLDQILDIFRMIILSMYSKEDCRILTKNTIRVQESITFCLQELLEDNPNETAFIGVVEDLKTRTEALLRTAKKLD